MFYYLYHNITDTKEAIVSGQRGSEAELCDGIASIVCMANKVTSPAML